MNKTVLWIIGGVVGLGLIVGLAFSIASEESLWYYDWVEARRAIVDSLSDGKIG